MVSIDVCKDGATWKVDRMAEPPHEAGGLGRLMWAIRSLREALLPCFSAQAVALSLQ